MKTVVLLHGSYGSPYENWLPSVSEGIRSRGDLPLPVALPTPHGQDFDTWARILDGYVDSGLLNRESVVVAHSSSCAFAVRYIAHRALPVRALVTVAGFSGFVSGNSAFDSINAAVGTTSSTDYEAVRDLATTRIAYLSDNDPNLPKEVLDDFVALLGSEAVVVPDAGHFNSSSGYASFEALDSRVAELTA